MKLWYLIESIESSERHESIQERFPHRHGPFNSKTDVYHWFNRVTDAHHYWGSGPQRNILKGHGGTQDAWYGYIERTAQGVFFYCREKLPFKDYKNDYESIAGDPLRLSDIEELQAGGIDPDKILKLAMERGISRPLAKILSDPNSGNYKKIDEVLALELTEVFEIPAKVPKATKAAAKKDNKPTTTVGDGRYGIETDDFLAAIIDGNKDHALAKIFDIGPSQAREWRAALGFAHKRGRKPTVDRSVIQDLVMQGRTDKEISSELGISMQAVGDVARGMRIDQVQELFKDGHSVLEIVDKLGLPKAVVTRAVNGVKAHKRYNANI